MSALPDFCPNCGQPREHWMLAAEYRRRTGETPDSIRNLRRKGQWIEGEHYRYDALDRMWVNYTRVMAWVAGDGSLKESSSANTTRAA